MEKRSCSLAKQIFKKVKSKINKSNFQTKTRDAIKLFEGYIKNVNLPIYSALIHTPRGAVIYIFYLEKERYALYIGTDYRYVRLLDLFHFPNISTLTPICRDPHRLPPRVKGLKKSLSPYADSLEVLDRQVTT